MQGGKKESENRRCWWPQKLLQNSKTEAGSVFSHDIHTLNCHECVIRLLGDALCVCGLQFSVSWLQLPGRCNLRLSHKQIHTEKDRRVGCIFIISLLWNQSPESQKGPAARTVDFFSCTEGRNNAIHWADGWGGHWEQWGGVQSVLHTHQHMQIHTDTQQECTRRVWRGQRSTVGCRSLYCILCPCNGQITLLNRQIR